MAHARAPYGDCRRSSGQITAVTALISSLQVVKVMGRMPMPSLTEASETRENQQSDSADSDLFDVDLQITAPTSSHGAGMWRVASESGTLDRNSSYAYLMFSRDFSATSRVALLDGEVVGFVMGYRRPDAPDRYFVWQIAVDEGLRGRNIAGRMLDDVTGALPGVRACESTITPDNHASRRLFESFAKRHGATFSSSLLFDAGDFPDDHEPEWLCLIDGIRS